LADTKPTVPTRIFLSHGHDSNEELVRLIRADLEKRGHDVWFDKSEIRFGDDWRRAITGGILKSGRLLSFFSKYSTRNPGVCRCVERFCGDTRVIMKQLSVFAFAVKITTPMEYMADPHGIRHNGSKEKGRLPC